MSLCLLALCNVYGKFKLHIATVRPFYYPVRCKEIPVEDRTPVFPLICCLQISESVVCAMCTGFVKAVQFLVAPSPYQVFSRYKAWVNLFVYKIS